MAFNIMGNYKNQNEQDLIADLVEEAIEQRGAPVHYILREQLNPDLLLGESTMSAFKEFYELPMFVESVEHFNGNGDVFDAFGINQVDSSIFQVGVRKFRVILENSGLIRPREGDLIYLEFSDSLWEITKVKKDLKYYQAGKNYTYRLICKLFNFSHEEISQDAAPDFELGEDLSDDNIRSVLGIANPFVDESKVLKQEIVKVETYPSDAFGF